MSKTVVVNRHHEKFDVYIGRGTAFGNKFEIGRDGTREECIEKFRVLFNKKIKNERFLRQVRSLKGKRLGCSCKPQACHGDVIVEFLEGEL